MSEDLKRTYFILLFPSILGFLAVCCVRAYKLFRIGPIDFMEILAPSIFVLSVILAVALPIFYRTFFAHNRRHVESISEMELNKFERNLIYITLVTPYLALAALLLELPRFYTAGTILMGIYAVYYFYPSRKRIALDRRIFRVKKI
jgi:hypothetical protein